VQITRCSWSRINWKGLPINESHSIQFLLKKEVSW
jgi:hypothetical protein